ncbi:MAG: helix-turn-helix transcriptional regulator [Ottowia sp.]|nr:helix-turn-helix transcriptional regulator [Ottowia sp.]
MSTLHSSQPAEVSHNLNAIIRKNLKHLMERAGIDAAELSRELGFAISTLNVIRRGSGNPTIATLEKIADYFKISVSDLVGDHFSEDIGTIVCEVPLISFGSLDAHLNKTFIPSDYYKIELDNSRSLGGVFTVTVDRNGLAPFLEKGSVLVVDEITQPRDMDIVIVKMGNHVPCVRRALIHGDSYIFSKLVDTDADSDIQPSIFKIIGVVIKIIINFEGK